MNLFSKAKSLFSNFKTKPKTKVASAQTRARALQLAEVQRLDALDSEGLVLEAIKVYGSDVRGFAKSVGVSIRPKETFGSYVNTHFNSNESRAKIISAIMKKKGLF